MARNTKYEIPNFYSRSIESIESVDPLFPISFRCSRLFVPAEIRRNLLTIVIIERYFCYYMTRWRL